MNKQNQFYIQDHTGRKLVVSRDVYNAIQQNQKMTEAKQKQLKNKLDELKKEVSSNRYIGKSKNLAIAAEFGKDGEINEHTMKINFKKPVSQETQQILFEFMMCINQATTNKNLAMASKLKEVTKTNKVA